MYVCMYVLTGDVEPNNSENASSEVEPSPSASGEVEPRPSASGEMEPSPSASSEVEPSPSASNGPSKKRRKISANHAPTSCVGQPLFSEVVLITCW